MYVLHLALQDICNSFLELRLILKRLSSCRKMNKERVVDPSDPVTYREVHKAVEL